jgi:hypothetical protein
VLTHPSRSRPFELAASVSSAQHCDLIKQYRRKHPDCHLLICNAEVYNHGNDLMGAAYFYLWKANVYGAHAPLHRATTDLRLGVSLI